MKALFTFIFLKVNTEKSFFGKIISYNHFLPFSFPLNGGQPVSAFI